MAGHGQRMKAKLAPVVAAFCLLVPFNGTLAEEKKPETILKAMSDFLKSAKSVAFSAEATWDLPTEKGIFVQVTHQANIQLRRPNKIRVLMTGDVFPRNIWYDGKKVTTHNPISAEYATQDAPDTIDATIDFFMKSYDVSLPMADFLYSDPYAAFTTNQRGALYVGRHMVRGVPTHHLVFLHDGIDWQIWIEDGDKPLPRKFAIVYRTKPGVPRYTAYFSDWKLEPPLSDKDFTFVAPPNAKRVTFVPLFE
jgi:hypothetical protein